MPFPNYHAARVREPKDFKADSIRTIKGGFHVFPGSGMVDVPKNILVITGQLLEQHYEGKKIERAPQSLRFPKDSFSKEEAKRWLKDERIKIIMFEPATETIEKVEEETNSQAKGWYNYINDDSSHVVEIMGDIGEGGYTAEALKNDILANDPESLTLNISSLGGNVNDALQVYDFLRSYKGQVVAKITGMTASAASIIAMGADNIEMSPHSLLLIHNVWSPFVSGSASDLEKSAQDMRKIDSILAEIYRKKTNKRKDSITKLMDEERWLNFDEALSFGLVDRKLTNAKNNIDLSIMNSLKERGLPSLPNVILNKLKKSDMELSDIYEKIEGLSNKLNSLFTPKDNINDKEEILAKHDAEVIEIKNLIDTNIKTLEKDLEAKNQELEAKNLELNSLKNTHDEAQKKLNDELDRINAVETNVIKEDEVELEKVSEPESPFDSYAQTLRR